MCRGGSPASRHAKTCCPIRRKKRGQLVELPLATRSGMAEPMKSRAILQGKEPVLRESCLVEERITARQWWLLRAWICHKRISELRPEFSCLCERRSWIRWGKIVDERGADLILKVYPVAMVTIGQIGLETAALMTLARCGRHGIHSDARRHDQRTQDRPQSLSLRVDLLPFCNHITYGLAEMQHVMCELHTLFPRADVALSLFELLLGSLRSLIGSPTILLSRWRANDGLLGFHPDSSRVARP